jgi:C4-dicarboxylate transporter DctM subunit
MRAMSETAAALPPTSDKRSPLRIFDDLVFGAENSMVAIFLIATTILMFIDVVDRRLHAPDSRLGAALGKLLFISNPATQAVLDSLAPWIGGVVAVLILVLAFRAGDAARGKPFVPALGKASPFVMGLVAAGAVAALGYGMMVMKSRDFCILLFVLASAPYVFQLVRGRAPGWLPQLVAYVVIVVPAFLWFALNYFPEGFTWSKEISMLFVLWVGLYGASICAHEGKHLRLEALEKSPPQKIQRYMRALSFFVAASFCAFFAFLGWRYTVDFFMQESTLTQTGVPLWVLYSAIPLAFFLTAIRFLAATVSVLIGGTYGASAASEGMEEAEKIARERGDVIQTEEKPKKPIAFFIVLGLVLLFPIIGKAGVLVSVILAGALLAEPLFVVLGSVTIACMLLWGNASTLQDFSTLVERMSSLADNQALLAIPLFIMSGSVMSHGQISKKLIGFAQALVGWLPGGLAISAVLACMIFAAISGSSPATVVAIGGMMAPALIAQGYKETFAHGLVTSAGSLGILIPPSIPMIVYAIVNTTNPIQVEALFGGGFGPGFIIGGILMGVSLYRGIVDKTPRQKFSLSGLWIATRDGFWALMFPGFILGGIAFGIFNAVESAACSVVYAVLVEVFIHRAIKIKDLPNIFKETGLMLGSFLVILVVATAFGEFLEGQGIPVMATEWISGMHLSSWQFLLAVNLLLLVVGCLMDIMSAIFIFVPLLAPMATAVGIDPIHFGIIFIVNLEIGYLTPPVGLNLFVASTLFGKSVGHITKSVAPFIVFMLIGLGIVTYFPEITLIGSRMFAGAAAPRTSTMQEMMQQVDDENAAGADGGTGAGAGAGGGMTMEEMMRAAEAGGDGTAVPPGPVQVQTMEEMMRMAAEASDQDAGAPAAADVPDGGVAAP